MSLDFMKQSSRNEGAMQRRSSGIWTEGLLSLWLNSSGHIEVRLQELGKVYYWGKNNYWGALSQTIPKVIQSWYIVKALTNKWRDLIKPILEGPDLSKRTKLVAELRQLWTWAVYYGSCYPHVASYTWNMASPNWDIL